MNWLLWQSGADHPGRNMAVDEMLLEFAGQVGGPILRFYGWREPAATFGYFQKYQEVEKWTNLRPLIRRPTGGGLVPHDRDWTYSLIMPPGSEWYRLRAEESYRRMHDWVRSAFDHMKQQTALAESCVKEAPGRCFSGAEKFDLLFQGQKIAGAAQRRNKLGLLIQGSVQNHPPGAVRAEWEKAMLASAEVNWGAQWQKLIATPEMINRASQLAAQKYSQADYNQRR